MTLGAVLRPGVESGSGPSLFHTFSLAYSPTSAPPSDRLAGANRCVVYSPFRRDAAGRTCFTDFPYGRYQFADRTAQGQAGGAGGQGHPAVPQCLQTGYRLRHGARTLREGRTPRGDAGAHRRTHHRPSRHGQEPVHRPQGRHRTPAGLCPEADARRRAVRDLQAPGPCRLHRSPGNVVPHSHRGAQREAGVVCDPLEGPAAASRQVGGTRRPRDPLSSALSGPDLQRRGEGHLPQALADRPRDPQFLPRARLRGGGDADDAGHPRRCGGPAVQDASQCPRLRVLHAHRAGTLPQAHAGGRRGQGVRDRPQFPQ